MPEAAITTDIIVGFPGETEEDFAQTLHVVREARFAGAFTFQYSKRPGTPAATMPDQVPHDVVQERYERLVELVNDVAWTENRAQTGRVLDVLVAEGEGRKDEQTERLVRTSARQPARPRGGRSGRRRARARATSSRPRSPTPHRTISSPTACSRCAAPAPGDAAEAARQRRHRPPRTGVMLGLPAVRA